MGQQILVPDLLMILAVAAKIINSFEFQSRRYSPDEREWFVAQIVHGFAVLCLAFAFLCALFRTVLT